MKGKYRRSIGKFYDKKMDNGTSNFGAMRNRIPGVKQNTVAGLRLPKITSQSSNPETPAITFQSSRLSSVLAVAIIHLLTWLVTPHSQPGNPSNSAIRSGELLRSSPL